MSNLVSTMFNPGASPAAASGTSGATTPEAESNMPGMPPMGGGFDSIFQS